LLIPIPEFLVGKAITGLQIASAEGTYRLFRWFGVPVLKNGFYLALPSLDIEIAKQCSGIRSSLVLVISSLVLGHLFLRSSWGKILVVLLAIPVAIAKNAVRIFVLSMLGIHWNPAFLYGNLHRNGGIVFFALALAGMVLFLKLIRQVEKWIDRPPIPQPVMHHLSTLQS
jgi:exosortase